MWYLNPLGSAYNFPHISHEYGFSTVWTTIFAFKWYFYEMIFYKLYTDSVSLQCGLPYVYSMILSLRMLCLILYICMVFSQCGLPYDYPSDVFVKMNFHILYTNKVILQYELSNVYLIKTFVWKTFQKYCKQIFFLKYETLDGEINIFCE